MFNFAPCSVSRFREMCTVAILGAAFLPSFAQVTEADIFKGIDASVAARDENLLAYNVTEHYAVFRNQDKVRPAAEMTVKTAYQKDKGKSYTVLSETGSELIRKQVLSRVLDSERTATEPANRATALITTANYTMRVKGHEVVDGRNCIALAISPRRNAPYLFEGNLWVDAQDYSIVQLEGVTSKSPSVLAGPTEVARQYAPIDGFPMATHATATAATWLLGQTTIEIDYSGYQIDIQTAR
jgi:hypothetical protein